MSDQYESLGKDQLIALLRKRDGQKKLGLVWERDEIEADRAIDANFVACSIDGQLSDKAAPWPNLVIEGDNFDALRWLRMTHAKRIKCIYIDPPYNTGNKDWVYNDHYIDKNDRWRHSTWLEFLYQRLTLARDLLADDGVMLISIRVRTHYSHQMTAAARAIAPMKFLMLRSKRVAMRRQSLSRQNMRSMMLRCL